ncbi:MAG: hypothetical protein ACRD8A_12630 [Candidatus Acidiferrales bacterium]
MSVQDTANAILAKWGGGAPAAAPGTAPGTPPPSDDHQETAKAILAKWGSTAPKEPAQSGNGFYQKLTAGYNPGAEEFAEKHPVIGPAIRALDEAGGTVLGAPGALYDTLAHPAKSVTQGVKGPLDTLLDTDEEGPLGTDPREWIGRAVTNIGRNLYRGYKGGVLPEALGVGAGNVVAGKLMGELTHPLVRKLPRAIGRLTTAAKTTPEELAERAGPGLEASMAKRQGIIRQGIRQADQNTSPLYENLREAEANASGGVDLSEVEGLPQPKTPAAKLTTRELTDAGLAGKQATRFLADGMSEAEARQTLKGLGYAPKVVDRALQDVAYPNENGGYTLDQARAIRRQVGRDLYSAEGSANPDRMRIAALKRTYGQVTDAMRDRAQQLGGPEGLRQFDLADAKYRATREAERQLRPLLDADSPEEFQQKWDKLNTVQKNRLRELSADAGLDLDALKEGNQTARKVLAGTTGTQRNGFGRRMVPYYAAKLGLGLGAGTLGYGMGRKMGSRDLEYAAYPAGMLAMFGGLPVLEGTLARAGALEEVPNLPRPLERAGFGRVSTGKLPDVLDVPARVIDEDRMLPEQGGADRAHLLPAYNGPAAGPLDVPREPGNGTLGYLPSPKGRSFMRKALPPAGGVNLLDERSEPIVPQKAAPRALPVGGQSPKFGIRTVGGRILDADGREVGSVGGRSPGRPETAEPLEQPARQAEQPRRVPPAEESKGRAQLAKLNDRIRALNIRYSKTRPGSVVARNAAREMRELSARRDEIRTELGDIREEAEEPEQKRPARQPRDRGPRESQTPTLDALPENVQADIKNFAKQVPGMNQLLREDLLKTVRPFGRKGARLTELLARHYAHENGVEIRRMANEPRPLTTDQIQKLSGRTREPGEDEGAPF